MSTTLADDELLAEARLPLLSEDTKFGFNEFSRRAGDFAMAASLATYRVQDGKISDARIGVGGAESFPRRIPEAEAALNGNGTTDAAFRTAANAAAKTIDPLEDHQTNADYRRDLVRAVVRPVWEQGVSWAPPAPAAPECPGSAAPCVASKPPRSSPVRADSRQTFPPHTRCASCAAPLPRGNWRTS